MAIGGFNGSDPSPTLAQFKAWVAAGRIHYFIAGGGSRRWWRRAAPGSGSSGTASQITRWVELDVHRQDGLRRHPLRPVDRLLTG